MCELDHARQMLNIAKPTVTLECDGLTLVVKKVPARVCQNCGEEYVDDSVASELFSTAATTARSGAEFDVRHYLKAA